MKDFFKKFSSLIIAIGILLGIFFLPERDQEKAFGFLDFLSKGKETAGAFGRYLLQNSVQGLIVFVILFGASVYAKKKMRG